VVAGVCAWSKCGAVNKAIAKSENLQESFVMRDMFRIADYLIREDRAGGLLAALAGWKRQAG
jgi:hypothetical protein